jgi:hypothetical protein
LQDLQAAVIRKIQIENRQIVWLVGSQLFRFPSIGHHVYGELLLLKPLTQQFRQRRVIFCHKNAHRLTRTTQILEGGKISLDSALESVKR